MRLLLRLRDHIALRHVEICAVVAGEGLLDEHPRDRVQRFFPLRALRVPVDAETAQLHLRAGLTRPELDAPAGHEVERRDPLGHARGVVEPDRQLHDAVSEPDPLRPLARRGEEHLRRARVRVLLEEMVLDLPDVVEAEAVGELDLVERVLHDALFGVGIPRPRELVLVEETEPHRARFLL